MMQNKFLEITESISYLNNKLVSTPASTKQIFILGFSNLNLTKCRDVNCIRNAVCTNYVLKKVSMKDGLPVRTKQWSTTVYQTNIIKEDVGTNYYMY